MMPYSLAQLITLKPAFFLHAPALKSGQLRKNIFSYLNASVACHIRYDLEAKHTPKAKVP